MKFKLYLLVWLFSNIVIFGQQKITVESIYRGMFRTQDMEELHLLKKSNQYTVLNYDATTQSSQVDLFDFSNLSKKTTFIDSKEYEGLPIIDSYSFDSEEKKMLLACNSTPIYRHSFLANYYLFDIEKKELTLLFEFQIQEPKFSPDGSKIAFARDNNLFVYDIATKITIPITNDGKKNTLINGIADWVYEEEFSFVRAFDWSKDSKRIAYLKFDESDVPEFSMTIFGQQLYPTTQTYKYPKAGEKNSAVSLHIYNIDSKVSRSIDLSNYKDFYIPRFQWTNDSNVLSVQVLNRHQDNLDLLFIDGNLGTKKVILNEKDKAYIDVTDNLTFLKDNSFIWTSEKDGFNHIYYYDKTGKLKNQVTKGYWEVTKFYGLDEKTNTVFYQSTENGSINRGVYKIGLKGTNKVALSNELGTNEATFSPNFDYYIRTFSSKIQPAIYTLNEVKSGKELKMIEDNTTLVNRLKEYNLPAKEFFILKTPKGIELNAWVIKPNDFDVLKKYPVFITQYSGPNSQEVANRWNTIDDFWYMMLAQQGYIIVCVDGRGTGFKGADFKKITQFQLGKYELEDLIDAAKYLGNLPYVDKSRIGIFGWSYGGFMATNCLLKGNDIFKMAIAVAPVSNWRFYDSVYTERYMHTPQENPSGYDDNSPINFVNRLKGKYLLIHGSADDNVHLQNTMLMMNALIQANKQFDSQIYPDCNHGIYGGMTRIQLFNKLTNFIHENL